MYLGIDIGTSAVKAAVVDDAGSVVDQATSPLTVSRPQPLWSEQNPALSDLRLAAREAVRAIGLSGQTHGTTLINKQQRAAPGHFVERRPRRCALRAAGKSRTGARCIQYADAV